MEGWDVSAGRCRSRSTRENHNSWRPTGAKNRPEEERTKNFADGVGTGLATIVAGRLLWPFGKVTLGVQQLAPNVGPKRPKKEGLRKKTDDRPPVEHRSGSSAETPSATVELDKGPIARNDNRES